MTDNKHNWNLRYTVVLLLLLAQIICYYLFTQYWQ